MEVVMTTHAEVLPMQRRSEEKQPVSVHEHYLIEKELASRLRRAPKHERRTLYSSLYDELFRRVPNHVQLTTKVSPEQRAQRVREQMVILNRFLSPTTTFMEIGCGDCSLSFHAAQHVRQVHGVDVSDEITQCSAPPANFRLSISDGTSIPVPPGSIDVAYSNQLMEHLHPEDALEQLANIRDALAPGGVYVCITPSRFTGPHDVSRYFDTVATGFHLKEYSVTELTKLFRQAGFRQLRAAVGGKGRMFWVPPAPLILVERLLDLLPARTRRKLAKSVAFRWMLGVRLSAKK
jgi:SAM-dependent methyltransferase